MSLLAMNNLYKYHILAKQNLSSRQSCCVATSNGHINFVSLFITCYKHIRLVWWPQVKLQLLQIPFWDYCNFLPTISTQRSYQINIR